MRGVNLCIFDFDFDLTWAAFFIGPDQSVYGRYGGRDAASPDGQTSLAGLRHAMAQALAMHARAPTTKPLAGAVHTADEYPAAMRRPPNSCIHCHHVYDFRREALLAESKWRRDELWVYPLPENVGLTLEVDQGDLVKFVARNSPADRAGLRAGDRLRILNGINVAAIADVQYGLQRAPASGQIPVTWARGDVLQSGRLNLAPGWRQTDISWRWSLRGVEPSPGVDGEDLSGADKKRLGLSAKRLAFYQSAYVSTPARQAGIHANDVIVGVDNKPLQMSARQFLAYIRLNFKVGDQVTYNLIRNGKPLDIPMTLSSRPPL